MLFSDPPATPRQEIPGNSINLKLCAYAANPEYPRRFTATGAPALRNKEGLIMAAAFL